MADNSVCQLCGAHDLLKHALIDCSMSRCVWALVDENITNHMQNADNRDARSWLTTMTKTLGKEDQVKLFVTLWAIWHARRKAIHEKCIRSLYMFIALWKILSLITGGKRAFGRGSELPLVAVAQPRPK
jgi:hypothetical protein